MKKSAPVIKSGTLQKILETIKKMEGRRSGGVSQENGLKVYYGGRTYWLQRRTPNALYLKDETGVYFMDIFLSHEIVFHHWEGHYEYYSKDYSSILTQAKKELLHIIFFGFDVLSIECEVSLADAYLEGDEEAIELHDYLKTNKVKGLHLPVFLHHQRVD